MRRVAPHAVIAGSRSLFFFFQLDLHDLTDLTESYRPIPFIKIVRGKYEALVHTNMNYMSHPHSNEKKGSKPYALPVRPAFFDPICSRC